MLSELYEMLPEAGDLDKPKLAVSFDEAYLLFRDAPKVLLEKVEQVVRLIRSKGVSVRFITQNPSDIPDSVLVQIGNRVQHALRAYTPNDQKALRAAARSFRINPAFNTEEALQALGVGEALVSVLDEKGVPSIVEKAGILPRRSSMSAAPEVAVKGTIQSSPLNNKYGQAEDRRSAYEVLKEVREKRQPKRPGKKSSGNGSGPTVRPWHPGGPPLPAVPPPAASGRTLWKKPSTPPPTRWAGNWAARSSAACSGPSTNNCKEAASVEAASIYDEWPFILRRAHHGCHCMLSADG